MKPNEVVRRSQLVVFKLQYFKPRSLISFATKGREAPVPLIPVLGLLYSDER